MGLPDLYWKVVDWNIEYIISTYPSFLCIPFTIAREDVNQVINFNPLIKIF